MNIQRLLSSYIGRLMISILLGLGLATMFRKACSDGSCIEFNGPVIDEVNGKTYQFGDLCYNYELVPTKCDNIRKTVNIQAGEGKTGGSSWIPFASPTIQNT